MAKYRFNVRDFTRRAYEAYFGMKLGDQDKYWAPHEVCKHCTETLRFWTQGKVSSMLRFGVPMVWREPKNDHDDCYFCMVNMSGSNQQKNNWYYPDMESARRSISHCTEVPVFTSLPDLTAHKMLLEAMDDTDSSDSSINSSSSMAAAASSLQRKTKTL